MIRFNSTKFKAGQQAVTRDGQVATFACLNPDAKKSNALGAYVGGLLHGFFENGVAPSPEFSHLDLVSMVPAKPLYKLEIDSPRLTFSGTLPGHITTQLVRVNHDRKYKKVVALSFSELDDDVDPQLAVAAHRAAAKEYVASVGGELMT